MFDLSRLTVLDTETLLIEPGILAPRLVCCSTATAIAENIYSKEEAKEVFLRITDGDRVIGGQNLAYDFGVMAARHPELIDRIFAVLEEGRAVDSMILEALHANATGTLYKDPITGEKTHYSLEWLEKTYLGIDRSAEKSGGWRLRYGELENIPLSAWPEEAISYPKRDARGTFDVLAKQLAPGRLNTQCISYEMQAAFALHLSSIWGMRTDPEMVRAVVKEITEKHEASRRHFLDSGIVKVRKATAAERREGKVDFVGEKGPMRYATDKKRLKALAEKAYAGSPPVTEKGQVSTSRDTLAESGDETLEEFAESGENEKIYSTYLSLLERGAKVPINPRYQVFLASDRVSCYDPNLQQLPRDGKIRECFVPRPGWVYNSVDYAALELCTVSQICRWWFGHSAMGDAINAGQDLHTRLAAAFKGISYDAAMVLKKAKNKEILGLRQICKQVNFGLGGLMGVPRLVLTARKDGVRLCESAGVSGTCVKNPKITEYKGRTISPTCEECLRLGLQFQQLYFSEWSEMSDYHAVCIKIAEGCEIQGCPAESMSAGHMLRLDSAAGAICNHFFQNLAARGAKAALWALSKEAYTDRGSPLYNGLRPVVFVHDEIISELSSPSHEMAFRQAEIMVGSMQTYVPDIRITAKPALMSRWYKGAEDVYENGRLVVWAP